MRFLTIVLSTLILLPGCGQEQQVADIQFHPGSEWACRTGKVLGVYPDAVLLSRPSEEEVRIWGSGSILTASVKRDGNVLNLDPITLDHQRPLAELLFTTTSGLDAKQLPPGKLTLHESDGSELKATLDVFAHSGEFVCKRSTRDFSSRLSDLLHQRNKMIVDHGEDILSLLHSDWLMSMAYVDRSNRVCDQIMEAVLFLGEQQGPALARSAFRNNIGNLNSVGCFMEKSGGHITRAEIYGRAPMASLIELLLGIESPDWLPVMRQVSRFTPDDD